jgi:hypothetical protein
MGSGGGTLVGERREALEKYSVGTAPIWRGHAPQIYRANLETNRLAAVAF